MDAIPQNGREQEKVQSLHVEQCPDITNTGDPMMDGGVHDQFIHRNIVIIAKSYSYDGLSTSIILRITCCSQISAPLKLTCHKTRTTLTLFFFWDREGREKEEEGLS